MLKKQTIIENVQLVLNQHLNHDLTIEALVDLVQTTFKMPIYDDFSLFYLENSFDQALTNLTGDELMNELVATINEFATKIYA